MKSGESGFGHGPQAGHFPDSTALFVQIESAVVLINEDWSGARVPVWLGCGDGLCLYAAKQFHFSCGVFLGQNDKFWVST